MNYRKLRIAWSVGCGIVCVLLLVLWVRSYWRLDRLWYADNRMHECHSIRGWIFYSSYPYKLPGAGIDSSSARAWDFMNPIGQELVVAFPHWLAVAFASSLVAIPWLRWQFSLRTLLIGMTVVAAALGLVIVLSR
jgi:hypothetical protein